MIKVALAALTLSLGLAWMFAPGTAQARDVLFGIVVTAAGITFLVRMGRRP